MQVLFWPWDWHFVYIKTMFSKKKKRFDFEVLFLGYITATHLHLVFSLANFTIPISFSPPYNYTNRAHPHAQVNNSNCAISVFTITVFLCIKKLDDRFQSQNYFESTEATSKVSCDLKQKNIIFILIFLFYILCLWLPQHCKKSTYIFLMFCCHPVKPICPQNVMAPWAYIAALFFCFVTMHFSLNTSFFLNGLFNLRHRIVLINSIWYTVFFRQHFLVNYSRKSSHLIIMHL